MPEPNRPLAERILGIFAGPTRAAAIYGDLLELSATHNRLWFWIAYTRTLLRLTWRTSAALLGAVLASGLMSAALNQWLYRRTHQHYSPATLVGAQSFHLGMPLYLLPVFIVRPLFFTLPFVLLRFGLRDRLSSLTAAVFLVALTVYSGLPRMVELSGLLTALLLMTALVLPFWRRSLIILAAIGIVTPAAGFASISLSTLVFHGNVLHLSHSPNFLEDAAVLVIATAVCVLLHRRLLESPPAPVSIDSIGAAHA